MLLNIADSNKPQGARDNGYPTAKSSWITKRFLPPVLTIVSTLLLWVGLATLFAGLATTRTVIVLWSTTLIASLTVSTLSINRLWKHQISATSIGVGFALFGAVYCLVYGDRIRASDWIHASVAYGTLTASPLIAFLLTWNLNRLRFAARQNVTDNQDWNRSQPLDCPPTHHLG